MVETAGIGQSDSEIVDLVDFSVYVMTSDYGAASQLEKIDMLDFADLVILNKYDKRGAEDALRDIRKQWKRNHTEFGLADDDVPVYPTIASQFNDPGVSWMFTQLCRALPTRSGSTSAEWTPDARVDRQGAACAGDHSGQSRSLSRRNQRSRAQRSTRRWIVQADAASRPAEPVRGARRLLEDPAVAGRVCMPMTPPR